MSVVYAKEAYRPRSAHRKRAASGQQGIEAITGKSWQQGSFPSSTGTETVPPSILRLRERKSQRKKELIQQRTAARRAKQVYKTENAEMIRDLQYRLSDVRVEIEEKKQYLARLRGEQVDQALLDSVGEAESQREQAVEDVNATDSEYRAWNWRAQMMSAGLEDARSSPLELEREPDSASMAKAMEELRTVSKLKAQARVLREELSI